MRTVAFSALTVFMFCLAVDGHYIPSRHHWTNSFHYPFGQRMHHGLTGYLNSHHLRPAFHEHPSAFLTHPSTFQGYPSAVHTSWPAEQAPEARPAFPAPGSITDERTDQGLDILDGLLRISAGNTVGGSLSLLRAF